MLRHHTTDISITYFCLALCSVGCAVCKVCLSKMESPMGAVAKFTSGQEIPGYRLMRRVSREVASLLGQMLALVALTVLCFLAGQHPRKNPQPVEPEEHAHQQQRNRFILVFLLALFQQQRMVLLTAMEMTLIVMYTFLATTAEQMLIRMAIADIRRVVPQHPRKNPQPVEPEEHAHQQQRNRFILVFTPSSRRRRSKC